MDATRAQQAVADGAGVCLHDGFDRSVGAEVLQIHWERSWDALTQQAMAILKAKASEKNSAGADTLYVTDPKSKAGDVHSGTWRLKDCSYGKPRNADNGITATYYRVYSPAADKDLADLAALNGRYLYGRQALNAFGLDEGVGEYASVTLYQLAPIPAVRTFCCDTLTDPASRSKILSLWRRDHAQWRLVDRKWDDTSDPGAAALTMLFRRYTWDRTWAHSRTTNTRGAADHREYNVQREVRGVPVGQLLTVFGAATAAAGNVQVGKACQETGDAAGAVTSDEWKLNAIKDAARRRAWADTVIVAGKPIVVGFMTVEFVRVSDADAETLCTDADAHCADMSKYPHYAFPAGYVLKEIAPDNHEVGAQSIVVHCQDGSYTDANVIDYGTGGPFTERKPIIERGTGKILGYHVYAWAYRVCAGRETANTFAAGSGEPGLPTGKKIMSSGVSGGWGKYIARFTYYVGPEKP